MDVVRSEAVEKELDAMIVRRSRKGDSDPDEREELWVESVRRYNVRRSKENRQAWQRVPPGASQAPEEQRGPANRLPRGRGGETLRGGNPVSGRGVRS